MALRPVILGIAAIGALITIILVNRSGIAGRPRHSMTCIYTRGGISGLERAERVFGAHATCTLAFDGGPTWATWSAPWFVDSSIPNDDWSAWVSARPGRHLVADVNLIPAAETANPSWRAMGAAGTFVPYARLLAAELVRGGLGGSFIRLGNEGNGPWEIDWIGNSPADWSLWRRFWRQTVLAMRSVPGAHFRFVWCISPGVGHVPLAAYYPGNDVVSVIGLDIYDDARLEPGRWDYLAGPGGVTTVLQFAAARQRPIAIPEWGLIPSPLGAGDDPSFVQGIAALSSEPSVAFQSYFDAGTSAAALTSAPRSLATYRRAFGSSSGS